MKETGPLDSHRTNSASSILEFLARNVRSAVGQRPAARSIVLIVAVAALCFGVALYFGASRISAEREHGNHDWPNHGKDLANTRFQNLDQINPSNVKNLQVAWVFHTGVLDPLSELEASPIEVDDRLFITDGHDDVFALNAATGQQLWKFDGFNDPAQLAGFFLCCGRNNHGVAFGDGKVFVGRFDDSVVALNAETGKVAWQSTVANFHDRVAINSAPQFVEAGGRELVVISLSGGEFEIRGQVFALDAKTGKTVWRFSTTQPTSFAGQSFLTGGGAVWNPPAIDPDLGLVYLSVGNAAPDIQGENRAGDNLFSASVVAVDLFTGNPVWHFQEVHHDIWDYDSAQPAVLFPVTRGGTTFKALGHCSKNGQYYILDRTNGKPIFPVIEVPVPQDPAFQHAARTQPFSVGVEPLTPLTFVRPNDTGFPPRPQYTPPGEKEFVMVPGDDGGCEWGPAAFSPRTKFVYYGTRYEPTTFKTRSGNKDTIPTPTGDLHLGSRFTNRVPGSHPFGLFGATDTRTGKIVWTFPKVGKNFALAPGEKEILPTKSGLTVAGDLVFFGEGNGKFHAADAETGNILFTFEPRKSKIPNVGGAAASPSVYVANGREFVAYAFGGNVPDRNNFAIVDPDSGKVGDAIIAFALPDEDAADDDD